MSSIKTLLVFFRFYALCLIVQVLGGYYTAMGVETWYPTLNKSPLTPPGMWFGIVWTMLYFLMAVAATRVWRATGTVNNRPLRWWLIQLIVGLVWCMVFFGMRDTQAGLALILFNLFAIVLTVYFFRRADHRAGLLLVPLLAWVSFASYLNLYIVLHN